MMKRFQTVLSISTCATTARELEANGRFKEAEKMYLTVKEHDLAGAYTRLLFSSTFQPFWSHLTVSPCPIDWGEIMHPTDPTTVLTLSRRV
jgi:hypothetical protein